MSKWETLFWALMAVVVLGATAIGVLLLWIALCGWLEWVIIPLYALG